MSDPASIPPGHPGITPRWTSSAKSGVGTATSGRSSVWFTVSHGILNEVYYPSIDLAATRDLGLLVTGPDGFFSEEKRDTEHHIEPLERGVPGYRIVNTCREGRYRITKIIITDPERDVVLQQVTFEVLRGAMEDYTIYALLAPHLGNCGYGNTGWVGDYKGLPMLFAQRDALALALASSSPFTDRSSGYVGVSDGWQYLSRHGTMTWRYPRAEDGNVALMGAIMPAACAGAFTLALAFGNDAVQAGHRARASLLRAFDDLAGAYVQGWRQYQQACDALDSPDRDGFDLYRTSTAVLRVHESRLFPGAIVASLSIPWGSTRGDDDLGGYHLIWPRDLVECAGGLLASGNTEAARQVLFYLMGTQEADGYWTQNMWLSGEPYWQGIQNDETAFPILLADTLRRMEALDGLDPWPMVVQAAGFLIRRGAATQQDRWEENAGFAVSTLAVEVAALLAAADFADGHEEPHMAAYLRETADVWHDCIDAWTYASGTDLARACGVDGYYVRLAPPGFAEGDALANAPVQLRNRPEGQNTYSAAEIIGSDALALVRFGLRAPDDPRILGTVKVIDATLREETATGPGWHRYSYDGYGEHADGSAFDGTGIGRLWPLLAGERAHYELAAGNRAEAERLLTVMTRQTSPGGLLPEQIWNGPDLPERGLLNGHPAGSAMPLAWAHAEYIKLVRSLHDDRVFDLPPQTAERYRDGETTSPRRCWRFNYRLRTLPAGKDLRIEVLAPASIHWSTDDWKTTHDTDTQDSGLGLWYADLPARRLKPGTVIRFTFHWKDAQHWEGEDFQVDVKS